MSGEVPRRARNALDALCRRIVPVAYASDPPLDIVHHVETRIASLEPHARRDVVGALVFFDHPVTGMLLSGRPRRFSTLPPAEQDALLREWESSSLALRRTVFQALRRLILSTYYSQRATHTAVGLLPPLHTRAPAFPWEGPAPAGGAAAAGEPIAREGGAPPAQPREWPSGIVPGLRLRPDTVIDADVCVVGSGAGGAVVAARLAEAGQRVVVLEEGGYYSGADFDDDEARLTPLLYADAGVRATDDLSIILLQGRCVGGGTTVNWMMTLRPPAWVLDEWEHEHRIELLSAPQLVPAMERMERAIHAMPLPDDAHSPANRVILDGCRTLGWSTLQGRINARGCVRAGACGLGCRWGAKQSAGDVFLPRALRAGATLYCDVRGDRIEVRERGGRAPLKRVHATIVDRQSRRPRGSICIDAPVVVLAAGAVGTPVILERSGLAGGGVGRWLRLHPTTAVFGQYDRAIYNAAGVPQSAVCSEFMQGMDGYGFWIEATPLRAGLAAAALPGFGAAHRERMRALPRLASLIALVRDGAHRERCTGDVRLDRRGRARIRYRLTDADRRQLVAGIQAAARLHFAAGATSLTTLHTGDCVVASESDIPSIAARACGPNRIALFSAHVNGTCRLGGDPRESGCSPEGERHGVRGLFVADGSLFPTAPGVNPQLAIMALADLVAERIADRAQVATRHSRRVEPQAPPGQPAPAS